MSTLNLIRTVCRISGILFCVFTLIALITHWKAGISIGFLFLTLDCIVIAIKNRCPFCHKSLRLAPIHGGEHCPHCGCEIK